MRRGCALSLCVHRMWRAIHARRACDQVGCGLRLSQLQLAWAVFDAGSFGFYSITYNTYAPLWFADQAQHEGMSAHKATARWAYAVAMAMLLSSLGAPLLGVIADLLRCRRHLLVLTMLGTTVALNFALIAHTWRTKLMLATLGYACYALSAPLYNAFLPHVAGAGAAATPRTPDDDKVDERTALAAPTTRHDAGYGSSNSNTMGERCEEAPEAAPRGIDRPAKRSDDTAEAEAKAEADTTGEGVDNSMTRSDTSQLKHRLSLMSTWAGNLGAGVLMLLGTALTGLSGGKSTATVGSDGLRQQHKHSGINAELQTLFWASTVWFFALSAPFLILVRESGSTQGWGDAKVNIARDADVQCKAGHNGETVVCRGAGRGPGTLHTGMESIHEDTQLVITSCDDVEASADVHGDKASRNAGFCARYFDLAMFLGASFFINEASSIVYQMNAIFALNAVHIPKATIVHATMFNRFAAVVCCFVWAAVFDPTTTVDAVSVSAPSRRSILGKLFASFTVATPLGCFTIAVGCTFLAGALCLVMRYPWQYWLLQLTLAMAGTGTFAFARSILALMTPPGMAARVFGFYTTVGRAAGSIGPFLFGLIVSVTGDQHSGFVVVVILFFIGTCMLLKVDAARAESNARQSC